MAPRGEWEEALATNKEKWVFNHSANDITQEGAIYSIWETKKGYYFKEFQEFVDGPTCPGFGLNALMNICKKQMYH